MRRIAFRLFLPLLLLGSVRLPAAGLEIVRVLTEWRDAKSFQRISEYFDGRENTGGTIILRTQPAERAGYYWLVRLKNGGAAVPGAKFELRVIAPSSPEPKTFVFSAEVSAGARLYQLGLTGNDWPGAKARPAAWRLRVLDAGGGVLAGEKSFLWEIPGK
ncbi:MAG: hypothetical protein A3G75_00870 [Verrucomicrobia bacterium RIFCSPLOWO2_12_FULL_64_8]|nr:MAG: hypothetical protein A3G75_00870 [Verrucomicrobia bacterium RIFCSPLOWO2_12_FULL_64_8]